MTKFRLVFYCPRPFSGYRFPLGAIVRQGGYEYVLTNDRLSDLNWSAIELNAHFVNELLCRLETDFSWYGDLPGAGCISPLVEMGAPIEVPNGVEDVQGWIRRIWEG